MTAIDDEAVRLKAVEAGCIAILQKPFTARALVDAIDAASASGGI
jgi:DNA-binding response OmpR family regulator